MSITTPQDAGKCYRFILAWTLYSSVLYVGRSFRKQISLLLELILLFSILLGLQICYTSLLMFEQYVSVQVVPDQK